MGCFWREKTTRGYHIRFTTGWIVVIITTMALFQRCVGFRSIGPNNYSLVARKYWMTSTSYAKIDQNLSIKNTPLGTSKGNTLLDGLDVFSVPASGDGHPLAVYGINSSSGIEKDSKRSPILLLHGRTWSSIPVYHLLGGSSSGRVNGEEHSRSRSLMETLYDAGLQPYAMDFRGFGGTPRDHTGVVDPNRCVDDTESVLKFIHESHENKKPTLLGWSQGALVAQLVAQKSPHLISKLTLYGSIYNRNVIYPRSPLYVEHNETETTKEIINTYYDAVEDFTIEGSIPPETARHFAEAALTTDPIKAKWNNLHEFNNCDPARVLVPTLLVAGDQDPYAPLRMQGELFSNLGRGADRTWSIIADADHAIHLLEGRSRFVNLVKSFVENAKKG